MLSGFDESRSIQATLNPFAYSDRLLDLKEQLSKRLMWIIENKLTKKQKRIIYLYLQGLTQEEISKITGTNQSSIVKSMTGNTVYEGGKKRQYGGSFNKLKRLCNEDSETQEILKEIQEEITNPYDY
jgi:hypothetical protein